MPLILPPSIDKLNGVTTAIVQLEKMPFTLGKQTSQYIGMGVREAIQQDFDTPIKESFQVPIANLQRATREARSVMKKVRKAARFFAFSWWGSVMGLGILLGALGYYFLDMRKFDDIPQPFQLPLSLDQVDLHQPSCECDTCGESDHLAFLSCVRTLRRC